MIANGELNQCLPSRRQDVHLHDLCRQTIQNSGLLMGVQYKTDVPRLNSEANTLANVLAMMWEGDVKTAKPHCD